MGLTLNDGGRELRLKALQAVADELKYYSYAEQVEILHPELQGQEIDVATAVLTRFGEKQENCIAEYFFRPIPGDTDGGWFFTSLITLRSDVPVEHVPELAFALSMTNFYIESGCFALNKPTDILVYKRTRSFAGDTPEEELIRDCVLQMEEAYDMASKYAAPVLELADGSLELTAFLELLKTD